MAGSASKSRLHSAFRPLNWLARHLQVSLGSLGCLARRPLGSLMTIAVLGIALALPAGLLVLLGNLQQVVGDWEGPASISLFLRMEVDDEQARALAERIRTDPESGGVQLVTRSEALEEFRQYSGFGAALDALDSNPLPALILVKPAADSDPPAAGALTERLGRLPEVELAQLDRQWVERLHGITEIARRGTWLIAGLLALGVLLIIGNTIRLEIQGRRDEIVISKLVGATDGFVRRPFLYQGLWLGLLGGITAWILVASAVVTLDPPISRLAGLYHSGFRLLGPGLVESGLLLAAGALTGLLGAWLAVGRHLSAIEPE
jgi:cell division transport system permease protein